MNRITDFFNHYTKAAWEKDWAKMSRLYDQDVCIFDMWNQSTYNGLSEWSPIIKNWLDNLKDEKVRVSFEQTKIQEGDKVGFASAVVRYEALSSVNQVLRSMRNRITLGFAKNESGWTVLHQHTSVPIDNELKAILQE